jgi:LCP family protein required for cell wall assembly
VSERGPEKPDEQAPPPGADAPGGDGSSADGGTGDGKPAPKPSTWAGREWVPEGGDAEDGSPPEDGSLPEDEGGEQDTVEADTTALADREAAREAALAGVRARAAAHAAKRGTGAVVAGERPATETKVESVAEEAAPPAPAPPAPAPAPAGEEGPPKRAIWQRFLAGSLLIVVAMTTATAVSLLVYLKDIARGLGGLPSVQSQLAATDPGQPQTILILGSDKRPKGQAIGARSDTTILLRVAPSQITVLSIPRDLKVNIPGHGIDRFNAAYSYGGPKLTLKVVKQLTGLDNINHVVNVDFTGFADAVNAIDCVYVDVDHHYYHSNVGLPLADRYAEINIPAGYQRMCGFNALQYVRYRHDDNDLVRAARQQEFLRDARQQVPASKILGDYPRLVEIMKKYVTSDIEHETDLISLAKLFLAARNAPVVQVHFPANLGGPTATYVTASESAIKQAVAKFEGAQPAATATPGQQGSQGGATPKSQKPKSTPSKPSPPPLIDSSTTGRDYAAKLAATKTKSGKPMLDIPVYYPTKLGPNSTITGDSRAFPIDGPGNSVYHGYKMVVETPTLGYEAYYGVSGTDWKDPPILDHPDQTKTINGQDYLLSWDGPQLRLIGWKTDQGSYWVDNTLLNALSPGQMFAIAQSLRRYTG